MMGFCEYGMNVSVLEKAGVFFEYERGCQLLKRHCSIRSVKQVPIQTVS